ncbi:MAG TPA: hypothetical protein PK997_07075 [Candidatus Omnitrophota bacterium]|jgi:hypothetical protein|nr:MAG: hypothetical protein BWY49_00886 [Candidatus Omnitrophica bacterium ADurb.Bin314]HOE69192.1 hypothetical protein [Candidatus Omnitrophota bacterium]HPW64761.1 hypothetical protein [Candidatus Omnitrophota bacterium]HQB94953.1 hypothetical protein [Candidatus Omnitrophota bacterium]
MNELRELYEMILTQRTWSWAILGILDLLLFLTVRSLYFRPLVKRAKTLNSKWYHEIKKAYLRRSLGGWLLFVVSLLLVVFTWQKTANLTTFTLCEAGLVTLIVMMLLFAAMSHTTAFGTALIHVLKQLENNQMTL